MESRIEHRKKDFKKTFEDTRRKREEQQVQIRKSQREERFSKRRQQLIENVELATAVDDNNQPSNNINQTTFVQVQTAAAKLMSSNQEDVAAGAQKLRHFLSLRDFPPIREVIETGAVPRLVELLDETNSTIQLDSAWALTNIASGESDQTRVVVNAGAVPKFARLLRTSPHLEVREQCIWALGNVAGDCSSLRDLVLEHGVLDPIVNEIREAIGEPTRNNMLLNACWSLSNLCRGKPRPPLEILQRAIPVLRDVLYNDVQDVLADACWALSYISDGNDEKANSAINAVIQAGVCPRIVALLNHPTASVQTPALRVVGNVVSGTESQTQAMIDAGCVQALKSLLLSSRRLVKKEACWTVSNITAGTQKQIQEVLNAGLIQDILTILPAAEADVRTEAWWALANAASGASPTQVHTLMDLGVMKELVKILECEDSKLQCVVLEGLETIFSAGQQLAMDRKEKENPYVLLMEEAGGYDALERFQFLPDSDKAYALAVKLMRNYTDYVEETVVDNTFQDYSTAAAEGGAAAAGGGTAFNLQNFSMQ